ncbi:MAG: heat-inducible transcriptional repressor [Chloroflexota bacterium]|nr:heat-inducible transcriptional repressor [Chloroflexota bacterium]
MKMKDLSARQKRILSLIVHEYIYSADTVASKHLVEKYKLDMSSATVRNEMSALTDEGYLKQPHTSAGRVPTEAGYRYFVGQLMQDTSLPEAMRRTINHQFSQMHSDMKQWLQLAATVLANETHAASLITAPQPVEARIKHIQLIATHGRQALAVLVMEGGQIHQHILTLEEPISQEQLSILSNKFSQVFAGKNLAALSQYHGPTSQLEKTVLAWMEDELVRTDQLLTGEIYMDGITNMLAEPEFSDSEEARKALRLLEERSLLQDLLSQTVLPDTIGGVQVLIGGEGNWNDLQQCSVVLSKYGSPGIATGTLGVLGPMRMAYGRSISMVRFLSGILSDFIVEQW